MTATPLQQRCATELPPGQKGPRGSILVHLKAERGLCAKELGERLGLGSGVCRTDRLGAGNRTIGADRNS